MKNKAIFLDRDGTINHDEGYIGNPNLIKLYDGVAEGIKILKNLGFKIIVISNQSGVTRGLISHKDVKKVNERINKILFEQNTSIDKFYYCPYHPEFDSEELSKCRKPSPTMVISAASENNIDLSKSFFIGDKTIDVECGKNAGVIPILLRTTINDEEINQLKNSKNSPNFIASDFIDAVHYIESYINGDIVEDSN